VLVARYPADALWLERECAGTGPPPHLLALPVRKHALLADERGETEEHRVLPATQLLASDAQLAVPEQQRDRDEPRKGDVEAELSASRLPLVHDEVRRNRGDDPDRAVPEEVAPEDLHVSPGP
jgi:hypothetical protein